LSWQARGRLIRRAFGLMNWPGTSKRAALREALPVKSRKILFTRICKGGASLHCREACAALIVISGLKLAASACFQ